MLVANCSTFQEIIGILFSFSFRNVLLNVFVKSDCFMQVNCFQIIEIYIVVDLS